MTLNRNPENFFAETEQVAFHPGHVVPGIDFTNDPLLQGRLFSYTDTQLSRLGSPNFNEIPINRSINEIHNNQRDAHMRMTVNKGKTAYFPNSIGGGCPHLAKIAEGGFSHYEERIDARKIRERSESFNDHFSQPAMFYRSLTEHEQEHVVQAYSFELGKCTYDHIKQRMLYILAQIDDTLASKVAANLGMEIPEEVDQPLNQAIGADADVQKHQPGPKKNYLDKSKALSQEFLPSEGIATRKIAVLAGDGFSESDYNKMKKPLEEAGAMVQIVGVHGGTLKCDKGDSHKVTHALMTTESVVFDALYIPGGKESIDALMKQAKAKKFINEALKHCKAIALDSEAEGLFDATYGKDFKEDEAVCINENPKKFIKAISKHRNWKREKAAMEIPA